jgi:hypothetical protein
MIVLEILLGLRAEHLHQRVMVGALVDRVQPGLGRREAAELLVVGQPVVGALPVQHALWLTRPRDVGEHRLAGDRLHLEVIAVTKPPNISPAPCRARRGRRRCAWRRDAQRLVRPVFPVGLGEALVHVAAGIERLERPRGAPDPVRIVRQLGHVAGVVGDPGALGVERRDPDLVPFVQHLGDRSAARSW